MNRKYFFLGLFLLCQQLLAASYDFNVLDDKNSDSNVFDQRTFENLDNSFLLPDSLDLDNSRALDFQKRQFDEQKIQYLRGLELIKNDKLQDAEIAIGNLLLTYPKSAAFHNLKAVLELKKNRIHEAIASYNKALAIEPANLTSNLSLSVLYKSQSNYAKASKHAQTALTINDQLEKAYLILAEIEFQKKNFKASEAYLEKGLEKIENNPDAALEMARGLIKLNSFTRKTEKNIKIAEKLVARFPENSRVLSLLAGAQINKQLPEAKQTLRAIISKDPKDVSHRLILARLLANSRDNSQEIYRLLAEVTALKSDKPEILLQTGVIYKILQDYGRAYQIVRSLRNLYPVSAAHYLLEGEIQLAEQKFQLAYETLNKAYQIKPAPKLLSVISKILITLEQKLEAMSFLQTEINNFPHDLENYQLLGSLYLETGKQEKAIEIYEQILEKNPDHILALNNLAWLYNQAKNIQAIDLAAKAYALAPDSVPVADTYGVILSDNNQLDLALQILQKANSLQPNALDVQLHLAQVHIKIGQKDQAVIFLKKILETESRSKEKNEAKALLDQIDLN